MPIKILAKLIPINISFNPTSFESAYVKGIAKKKSLMIPMSANDSILISPPNATIAFFECAFLFLKIKDENVVKKTKEESLFSFYRWR